MAINKITAPSSIPATVADYQAQNSHLMAFINQINSQAFILSDPNGTVAPTIKQGAYISHGGSLYIVDTADATISGTPSDGTVYIRVSGTDTLAAEYITDISSYAWNSAYNAMISGSYTLLPYMLVKSGTSWTKYRFEQHKQAFGTFKSLNVADNITLGGTVDGHDIDSELNTLNGRVNQGVKTTDSPTFVSINTGHGANELYPMDQDVKTTASPTFVGLTTSGNLNARNGIRARGTNSASYTGKDLWEAIEARVGDISGYAIDGIPLSGTCYLGDGTTQCILAYVWQSSTGTKPYYIRYQAIGSTSTTDSILVDHDNTSTVIVRHALLVLVGGHA